MEVVPGTIGLLDMDEELGSMRRFLILLIEKRKEVIVWR
jgi:hypothetical protein